MTRRIAALVFALGLAAAACSNGGGGSSSSTTDRGGRSSTTTTRASTTTTTTREQALAAGICPIPSRGAPDVNRPHYSARVDVRPAEGEVSGDLSVTFSPDLDVTELVFRLWPNAPRLAAAGIGIDVGPITRAGTALPISQPDPTTVVVALPVPLAAGDSIAVTMPWRLSVPGSASDRISRTGEAMRLGSFLPLLAWQPGVGWARDPATAGFAEAAVSPVADYDVSITVPAGLTVLASGSHDGAGRWRAERARDFAVSVGRFAVVTETVGLPDPVEVTVGVHDTVGEAPELYLERIVAALRHFALRYGPYPWDTFSTAITPDLSGGIEFPTHVMQGPGSSGRTTPHEVAHQWFYALVGNNQGRDPFLDEGVASFAEGRFESTLDDFGATSIPSGGIDQAGRPMTFWESHLSDYYRSVYVQGASALAALGNPDLIDCALRLYIADHAYQIATQADLVDSLTKVFPEAATVLSRYGIG